jgi:hypothetical protein
VPVQFDPPWNCRVYNQIHIGAVFDSLIHCSIKVFNFHALILFIDFTKILNFLKVISSNPTNLKITRGLYDN